MCPNSILHSTALFWAFIDFELDFYSKSPVSALRNVRTDGKGHFFSPASAGVTITTQTLTGSVQLQPDITWPQAPATDLRGRLSTDTGHCLPASHVQPRSSGALSPVGCPWPVQDRAAGLVPPPCQLWMDSSGVHFTSFLRSARIVFWLSFLVLLCSALGSLSK